MERENFIKKILFFIKISVLKTKAEMTDFTFINNPSMTEEKAAQENCGLME